MRSYLLVVYILAISNNKNHEIIVCLLVRARSKHTTLLS
jgi:hypothetical protein